MKTPSTLVPLVVIGAASISFGQNFNSATFFQPALRVQHANTTGVLLLDNALVSNNASAGNVQWTNRVGGYAGAEVPVVGGVHLHAYTETTGNSLVFGRDLEIDGLLSSLQATVNSVVGSNVLSTWSATADVTGLSIVAGQLYEVTFDVSSGPGLRADLINSASFDVSSSNVTTFSNGSENLLNLLDVVTIGTDPSTGLGRLQFVSSTNRSDLQLQFSATSLISLGLLGSVEGNQNVLTFSNIQVAPIPEPSVLGLSALAVGGLILRRRRG